MRRSTALIGFAALAMAVYVFFLNPLIAEKRAAIREDLEAKASTLGRYEGLTSGNEISTEDVKDAEKELKNMEKGLIRSTDASLAAALLQGRVEDLAERSGVSVLSLKSGAGEKLGGYLALPIEVEGTGTVSALSGMLKAIDSGTDYIRIDRLEVMSPGVAGDETLRLRIQASGLAKI